MIRSMIAALLLGATSLTFLNPPAAPSPSVREGARLIATTFYRKIEPSRLVGAERAALLAYLHTHGAPHATLPPVAAQLSTDAMPQAAYDEADAAARTGGISATDASTIALRALARATHDRYTTFFTAKEYHEFDSVLAPDALSGIGVLLDSDSVTKLVRAFFVVPDTPADRAGLRTGDLIPTIDGHSTRGFTIARARALLLGKAGTPVTLGIEKPGATEITQLRMTRANVTPPTVYFSMLPHDVAYVYVAAFGDPTPREFDTAIHRMEAAGARAYVLDLRNDGGGLVSTALSVLSHFIASGPLVSIESNGGDINTYEADDTAIAPKPLAVLVNGYTASASEITAAAIAESGAGVLVGTKTFGKGVVQNVTRFADGSAIKITVGRYFTPLNHDINGRGIVPRVVSTPNPGAIFGAPAHDAQLAAALRALGISG